MSEAIENLSVILLTLRKKLVVVAAVLFTGVALSFQFTGPLIERMKEDLLPEGAKLVYVSPLEVMMLKLKLSFIIGLLLALPFIAFYAYRAISRRFSVITSYSIHYTKLYDGLDSAFFILSRISGRSSGTTISVHFTFPEIKSFFP